MDLQTIQSRKSTTIARLIEAVIVLFLLSTRLPSAARLAGKSLSLISSLLRNPLANFVVFNSIILVLFLLSHRDPATSSPSSHEEDVFAEPDFEISAPIAEEKREKVEERGSREARREIRRFERTQSASLQSASLRREIQHGMPRQQLRRSETDIGKKRGADLNINAISIIDRVDTLSNEEFQRTIEEFIAKQQRFLWAQKIAEIDQ